jgi:alkyl sulfatase BDS1-like metallo-beta-lactamase superfamily hydrolase
LRSVLKQYLRLPWHVTQELGEFPIKAVLYSHAHADHFGGVRGIVSPAQVDSGEVEILAPRDFMEQAIKENVLAGNAMTRRASYQDGNVLPKSEFGLVDAAIGKGLSNGSIGLQKT